MAFTRGTDLNAVKSSKAAKGLGSKKKNVKRPAPKKGQAKRPGGRKR